MKKRYLLALIGGCLLFISFNMSITGCGKKGDLVRPGASEQQQTSPKKSKPDKQKQSTSEVNAIE